MPRMTCDELIASRTNNPDKLGREKWEKYYNDCHEFALRGKDFDFDEKLEREMMGEYLEKQGCTKDDASRIVTNALRNVLRNVDTDFEKQISPQAIKDVVKECHNLEAGIKNQSPTQTSQNFERF